MGKHPNASLFYHIVNTSKSTEDLSDLEGNSKFKILRCMGYIHFDVQVQVLLLFLVLQVSET